MREHPWSIRRPTAEHYQWFQNLLDLHSLTRSWFYDLKIDQQMSPHQLKRVMSPGIEESYEILERLTQSSIKSDLETILDDSYPEELLTRLEHTVWAIQAWSLRSILERTKPSELEPLHHALQQSSWKTGRTCFGQRWVKTPPHAREDMRGVVACFQNSPLSNYPHHQAFLIKRATRTQTRLELLACPHQSPFIEVRQTADDLCRLHVDWIRGFAYAMNTKVLVDYVPLQSDSTRERCQLFWSFHSDSAHSSRD